MIRYTVTNRKTGEVTDFKDQKEALDYAKKVNKERMARITELKYPDIRKDLGEMKYEMLLDNPNRQGGYVGSWCTVYRIKALRSFVPVTGRPVRAGDLGGWVGDFDSLSHQGDCWIYDEAQVYGNARVKGNAVISGTANVSGGAVVKGYAKVMDCATVTGIAMVTDCAVVDGAACIGDSSYIGGNAHITHARVYNERITGNAEINGGTELDSATAKDVIFVPRALKGCDITFYNGDMLRFEGKNHYIPDFEKFVDRTMLLSPREWKDLRNLLKAYTNK